MIGRILCPLAFPFTFPDNLSNFSFFSLFSRSLAAKQYDSIAVLPGNILWAGINLAPTAANVSIAGRVLNGYDRGVSGAIVTMTDSRGVSFNGRTNSFGYFKFEGIPAGETCVLSVFAKGLRFAPQAVTANDELTVINFTPQSSAKTYLVARLLK